MSSVNAPAFKGTFSVDTDHDGRVHLVAHIPTEDGERDRQEFVLEPDQYLGLLRDLAAHVSYAVRTMTKALGVGDCPTCGNVRLVIEEKHGRDRQVTCPDCGDKAMSYNFERPRIGGGLR